MASDFRVESYREAGRCLNLVRKQKPEQPEFWANLLGAIANATLASVPWEITHAVQIEDEHNATKREIVRGKLKEAHDHTVDKLTDGNK